MIDYHDHEWGVPLFDDNKLFEFITLDAFQAGLSWSCILHKRENFRAAFDGFDPTRIAMFDESRIEALLANAGIIRNRRKIEATIKNARVFLGIQSEFGSYSNYLWGFVDHEPIVNQWTDLAQIPVSSPESDAMSRDLKKRGMSFVGTTICYAFMQAAGMVNDHLLSCPRHSEVQPSTTHLT